MNDLNEGIVARHVRVEGRVQGVWFRAWTQEQAQARGVSGWVRNCTDGSVEATLSGPSAAVEALIAVLHEGPPAAKVSDVRVTATEPVAKPGFHIVD